jgi:hypothetical protein
LCCQRDTQLLTVLQSSLNHAVVKYNLQTAEWVSLTIDMWSDKRMRSFTGATALFVNSSMTFETYLLGCASFDGSHTGVRISEKCTAIVEEFQIWDQTAFVITDNAANMVKASRELCALFADTNADSVLEESRYEDFSEPSGEATLDSRMMITQTRWILTALIMAFNNWLSHWILLHRSECNARFTLCN